MMVRVVAMLAVLALSACGVGVAEEDPEGAAAATSQSALLGCPDPMACPQTAVVSGSNGSSGTASTMPGTVALPQDPIPWRPTVKEQLSNRPFGPNGGPETPLPVR